MVSTDTSGSVFTAICGSFDARFYFGVTLYRGLVEEISDTSLIFPRGHISHNVRINKARDQDGLAHKGRI